MKKFVKVNNKLFYYKHVIEFMNVLFNFNLTNTQVKIITIINMLKDNNNNDFKTVKQAVINSLNIKDKSFSVEISKLYKTNLVTKDNELLVLDNRLDIQYTELSVKLV